jgi:hypothetical protein
MRISCALGFAIAASLGGPAYANLSISSAPTQNVTCANGRCEATAVQAVLNVKELHDLFAKNSLVSVKAGVAGSMTIDARLTLSNKTFGPPIAITLAAGGPLRVNDRVSVAAAAHFSIRSNGLTFAPKASLDFWDLNSSLTINRDVYALFGDYYSLVIFGGQYNALAGNIDDHFEHHLQMQSSAGWVFDGLGHTISNLDVSSSENSGLVGTNCGTIRNLNLENARVPEYGAISGLVAGFNNGVIDHVSVSGDLEHLL